MPEMEVRAGSLPTRKSAPGQRGLARKLRATVAAPDCWCAEELDMGQPSSVRAYVPAVGTGVAGRYERFTD